MLIISTPADLPRFEEMLGDGTQLGMSFSYKVQPRPEGLAQAFLLGKEFIGRDTVSLVLGDNIFYGQGLAGLLQRAAQLTDGAVVFGYKVRDPERYGVVEFDKHKRVISIEEKPAKPKSKYAVTGLYFYDNEVVAAAESLTPSARGELEITDLNNVYLRQGKLTVEFLGRGYAWLDTGTHESLLQAASFVQAIQDRQGVLVACLEEIAYRMGYITAEQVERLAADMLKNGYGRYLMEMIRES